jgi:hypothetical protein
MRGLKRGIGYELLRTLSIRPEGWASAPSAVRQINPRWDRSQNVLLLCAVVYMRIEGMADHDVEELFGRDGDSRPRRLFPAVCHHVVEHLHA